jgi:hypothetical protein
MGVSELITFSTALEADMQETDVVFDCSPSSLPASGPLTWSQRAMWEHIQWAIPNDHELNLPGVLPVPRGRHLGEVLDAIRALLVRHDVLRTVYQVDDDGRPRQVVRGAGRIKVRLHETSAAEAKETATRLAAELSAIRFELSSDWPLRFAVVTTDGWPARVTIVASHMAVDAGSFRIICRELTVLMSSRGRNTLPAVRQQPLERAAYERSERGRSIESRSLSYWEGHLRDVSGIFVSGDPEPALPHLEHATIRSEAAAVAVRALAKHCGVSSSSVLLASAALLLGLHAGVDEAALRVLVATRFTPEAAGLVCAFNQNASFKIKWADPRFSTFLEQASMSALEAYRRSECDPITLGELVAEVARDRGMEMDRYCFFNDERPDAHLGFAGSAPADPALAAAEAEHLLARTKVWLTESPEPSASKFFLFVHELSETAELSLSLDRRFLTKGAERFLLDLEGLLVEACRADPHLSEIRQLLLG